MTAATDGEGMPTEAEWLEGNYPGAQRVEFVVRDRDTLARALYEVIEWSGCAGSAWDRAPQFKWKRIATSLINSGVIAAWSPAASEHAWGEPETQGRFVGRIRCVDCGLVKP